MTDFEDFRAFLVSWLEASGLFPDANLHVDLILNPHAGALRRRLPDGFPHRPSGTPGRVRVSTWTTDYPGHERTILQHLHDADPLGPGDRRLVVTAGGDGTSRGAMISALDLPPEVARELVFFRLPLGTGNDGADARDWSTALEALAGRSPTRVVPLPVIEVRAQGHPLHYSFNIASVGLDAFVGDLTNRLKTWFPGNSYSLMVDAAALFYEAFVRVAPTRIVLSAQGETVVDWNDRFLLAAFGASGRRTYGAGKRVLPDDDNFCMAAKVNLWTKLGYRRPFYEGTHRGLRGVSLARGDELLVHSPVRVPFQMDGEVLWLDPEAFPLRLTVVDHGLRVLALATSSVGP